jgi:hypothetical protein
MKTKIKMIRLKKWKNWRKNETITNLLYKNNYYEEINQLMND